MIFICLHYFTTAFKLSSEPKMVSNMDQAWSWHRRSLCGLVNYLFTSTNENKNGKDNPIMATLLFKLKAARHGGGSDLAHDE